MDDNSGEIPSLILKPLDEKKSTIRCHFPSLFFFGMVPTGPMWIPGGGYNGEGISTFDLVILLLQGTQK